MRIEKSAFHFDGEHFFSILINFTFTVQYSYTMSSSSRKVKFTSTAIIILLFLSVAILVGEVICRMDDKYGREGFQYDEHLIWRLNRNFEASKPYGMGKAGKPPFQLVFNENGFRGKNFEEKKEKDTKRIMFLGDSYTAGLDYPENEIFCNIVVKNLNNTSEKWEGLNASCPAWSTDQEYIYWKTEGKKYKPDYLLLMTSVNDIREAYKKKLIELDFQQNLKLNKVSLPFKEKIYWKLANRSSFFQYLKKKVLQTETGSFHRIQQYYPVNYGIKDADDWNLPIFLADPFDEVEHSFVLFEKLIAALNYEAKKTGTQLLLSINPATTEFNGNLKDPKYQPGIVSKHLARIAQAHKIPYCNMYEMLAEEEDPMKIFMSWEFHYDDDGHQWIADQLTKFVKQQSLN